MHKHSVNQKLVQCKPICYLIFQGQIATVWNACPVTPARINVKCTVSPQIQRLPWPLATGAQTSLATNTPCSKWWASCSITKVSREYLMVHSRAVLTIHDQSLHPLAPHGRYCETTSCVTLQQKSHNSKWQTFLLCVWVPPDFSVALYNWHAYLLLPYLTALVYVLQVAHIIGYSWQISHYFHYNNTTHYNISITT